MFDKKTSGSKNLSLIQFRGPNLLQKILTNQEIIICQLLYENTIIHCYFTTICLTYLGNQGVNNNAETGSYRSLEMH